MVNEVIVNYLKQNSEKFSDEDLKKKILSSGYSLEEYNEALNSINIGDSVNQDTSDVSDKKNYTYGFAGIGMLLFFILGIVFSTSYFSPEKFSYLVLTCQALFLVGGILFFYGFVRVSKKYDKFLLRIASYGFILIYALMLGFILISFFSPSLIRDRIFRPAMDAFASGGGFDALFTLLGMVLVVVFILLFILFILGILFFAGMIGLKDVKYSRLTGILGIVGLCLSFILIGFFILIIVGVFCIIILFREG